MKRNMLICVSNPCRWVGERSEIVKIGIPYGIFHNCQVNGHIIGFIHVSTKLIRMLKI